MADAARAGTEGMEARKRERMLAVAQRHGLAGPETAIQSFVPSVAGPGAAAPAKQDAAAILREAFPDDEEKQMRMQRASVLFDRPTGGTEDDEKFAARYLGQDTLEGPSMTAGLRMQMSGWGDTEEERQAVFEAVRPNGAMKTIPGTEITVFKEDVSDPDEKWRKADKGFIESITSGSFLKETGRDLAEFAVGEGPEMFGEAALLLGTKGKTKGGGVGLKSLFRLMVGNLGGGTAQEAAQRARGTARETAGEFATRQTTEAAASALGAGLFGAVSSGVARISGKGHAALIGGKEGAEEAVEASKRIFPKKLKEPKLYHLFEWQKYEPRPGVPVNYLTDLPLIQRVGRISAAIMPTLNRYTLAVDQSVKGLARAMIDPVKRNAFMAQATKRLEQSARSIKEATAEGLKFKSKHPRIQGETLQRLEKQWWKSSGKDVDDLAAIARSMHDPDFDLAPALKEADRILFRTVTPGKHEATGKIIGRGGAEEIAVPLVQFGRAPTGPLKGWIKRFKSIDEGLPDPTLPPGTPIPSKADRIQAMIRELSDMGLPAGVGGREPDLLARHMAGVLRDVFANPIGGDANFNKAWATMIGAASKRFTTRESLAVMKMVNTKRPSGIVDDLLLNPQRPATIDDLIDMRKATGREGWGIIRQEYKGRLIGKMKDPDALDAYLDAAEPNVKRMLMAPAEEKVIREQAGHIRKLYNSGIRESAGRHTRNRSFLKHLVGSGDTAKTDALADFLTIKGNENMRVNFQEALMDEIIEGSMRQTTEGVERVSGKAMREEFQKYGSEKMSGAAKSSDGNGLLELLDQKQVAQLLDVQSIQRLFDGAVEDAGTSLAGASAASSMLAAPLQALEKAFHMLGVARFLRSQAVANFLVGTGGEAVGQHSTRRTAMLVGSIATHLARGMGEPKGDAEQFEQLKKVVSLVPPTTP